MRTDSGNKHLCGEPYSPTSPLTHVPPLPSLSGFMKISMTTPLVIHLHSQNYLAQRLSFYFDTSPTN